MSQRTYVYSFAISDYLVTWPSTEAISHVGTRLMWQPTSPLEIRNQSVVSVGRQIISLRHYSIVLTTTSVTAGTCTSWPWPCKGCSPRRCTPKGCPSKDRIHGKWLRHSRVSVFTSATSHSATRGSVPLLGMSGLLAVFACPLGVQLRNQLYANLEQPGILLCATMRFFGRIDRWWSLRVSCFGVFIHQSLHLKRLFFVRTR